MVVCAIVILRMVKVVTYGQNSYCSTALKMLLQGFLNVLLFEILFH